MFYAPAVIKMASTKRTALRGRGLRTFDALLSTAEAFDRAEMAAGYPSVENATWVNAHIQAQLSLKALFDFVNPIIPLER